LSFTELFLQFGLSGELKRQLGVERIEDVVKSGQGLAFIAYPEAVSLLAVPPLWSFLFFFMLFLLGLDSEFALLETVLSGIYDLIPKTRKHKPLVTLALASALFLLR
jgi:SNF family Na+-dependent transporter